MPWLRDAQLAMKDFALGGPRPDAMLDRITGTEDLPASERLGIHRNNTRLGLVDALAHSYPVVARLVGPDFFEGMAKDFIAACPPAKAPLLLWGRDLSGFIESYAPARSVAYLADVAKLEAAWAHAYHAVEARPLDPAALTDIPPDRLPDLHFALHPSLRFITSRYPVEAIWRANQPESPTDGSIDLIEDAYALVVFRPEAEVLIQPTGQGAFAFLMALGFDQPLSTAWEAAQTVQNDFQLVPELTFLLSIGIFTEARLK